MAGAVAHDQPELGVMLPYTPMHHLLAADVGAPIVLTSGNASDVPIAYRDADALERLGAIADSFLVHDRPIHARVDDSVARPGMILRRSRGHVPRAIGLPVPAARLVLACGAELKSTFCLARDARAWVSHHVGDLKNAETLASYAEGVELLERLFAVAPEVVAYERGGYELPSGDGVLDARPLVRAAAGDVARGVPAGVVAPRFHNGLADATAEGCARAAGAAGTGTVVLSGGAFQNRRLLERTSAGLRAAGLRVLVPARLPANDGGIAYGQAAIAAAREAGA